VTGLQADSYISHTNPLGAYILEDSDEI
jgi:hypothetical protein